MKTVTCSKDCKQCKHLGAKMNEQDAHPWGWECLKYNDSVFIEHFADEKQFKIEE